jgi:hypothetical protein
MIQLKQLINEAGDFTAKSKESGKLVHFKSKDSYDKAIKAGSHEDPNKDTSKGDAKSGVNIFNTPKAGAKKGKDDKSKAPAMKHTEVGEDSLEVKTISNFTNLRAKALSDFINKNKLDATAIANFVKKGSLRDRMDIGTAIVGNPGNKYEKKVIKQFGAKEEQPKAEPTAKAKLAASDLAVDKVVYNTRTKSVGIVRLPVERGEVKTDADGNVNVDELEPYNPMKYPHQKDAKVAPSTQKEVDARGLWNPFAPDSDEPKAAEPKAPRKGDPSVNKEVRKIAQKMGISSDKMDKNEYQKKMAQAAVAALTDSNFHSEARELVAALEGKPELAEKPDYPNPSDPKFREKMDVIRAKYDSVYSSPDDDAQDLGVAASQAAGWSGDTAIDGIAFELRMNGFHKLADKIQSVIKEGKVSRTSLKNLMK